MDTPAKITLVTGCTNTLSTLAKGATDRRSIGSPGGIGLETAIQLLSKGQTVLLGIRSPEKRMDAAEQLESLALPGKFDILELDVAHPASISAAARVV